MKTLRTATGVVLIGVAVLVLAACGDDDSDEGSGGGKSGESSERLQVALLIPTVGTSYAAANVQGAKDQASKDNATVRVYDAKYDPSKENSDCQTAITSGEADAIIVNPVDNSALGPCVRAAKDADVPLVSFEAPLGPDRDSLEPQLEGVTGSVFNPTTEAGARLAELTGTACEGQNPCNVLYQMGDPAFAYDQILLDSFNENKDASVKIVQKVQTNFNPDDGYTKTKAALAARDDIHVIVTEDGTSRGVIRALDELGAKDVKVVGAGGSGYATEQIKKGTMVGTVPFLPASDGAKALEIAVAAARRNAPAETFVNGFDLTPLRVITADNAEDWTPEYD
jgi:ribose transport system substrate-binding protein